MTSSSNDKVCLILLGTSGTGKSTLSGILSGKNVHSSSSSTSDTQQSKIYEIDSSLSVIDTVGCEDSSGKPTSEILHDLVKFLAPRNITKIQCIWTTSPSVRSTQAVQKQAKWIGKLGKNIWKSTFMISKMGSGNKTQDVGGALGCINSKYKPTYKPLNLLDELDQTNFVVKMVKSQNYSTRSEGGYFWKKEAKTWLLKEMKKLETCHVNYVHFHTGSKNYKHRGHKRYRHSGSYKYIALPGAILGNIFTFGLVNVSSEAREDMYYYEWTCCGSKYENSEGCKFRDWSCCNLSSSSSGCTFDYWTCCGSKYENSEGCRFRDWSCCNLSSSSSGCTFDYWSCCYGSTEYGGGCDWKIV